ncbi:MAG: AsmA family protein, partial [Proteobacteria bacterium]|nr:AsmA family protein [Pseudomonadota bacterium]
VKARHAARTKAHWSRDPIDLSGLAGIDAALALKSSSIQFQQYRIDNADISVKLANGRLNADKLTGVLFGGALHATASATTTARPRVETVFALENMSIGEATKALTGKAIAAGRMSLKARLKTAGPHLAAMIGGLNGEGVIRLKGVDVKQGKTGTALAGALGLVSALNQFSGVLGGGAKKGSGLVDIAGSFAIRNGVASSQDIKVTSNLGDGAASGTIDLPRWRIDVKGHVQLGQNILTTLLAGRSRTNVTQAVPFTVRGRLDKPDINLDTSKLPGGALPIPGIDRLLKKAPKGLGGILQGILGGGVPQQGSQPPPPASEPPPPQPQPQQRRIRPEDLLKELFRRR